MDLKRTEFLNLRQGHRSVSEYIEEFSNLARYAPDDINTDAKRKERFLKGLNDELMVQLSVAYVPTYQALCDKAITLENTVKQVERRKRKHDKHDSGPPHKMRSYGEGSRSSRHHRIVTMRAEMGTITAMEMVTTTMAIRVIITTTLGREMATTMEATMDITTTTTTVL
jgi:hypothetical protein